MQEEQLGAVWQVAIHVSADRIQVAGELVLDACAGVPFQRSAVVCSAPGAIELLDSWFGVHPRSEYRVVVTGERAVPSEYCTHNRNLALQFVLTHLVQVHDGSGAPVVAAE